MIRTTICRPALAPALAWVASFLMAMAMAPSLAQAFSTAAFLQYRAEGSSTSAGECRGGGPPPPGVYRVLIFHLERTTSGDLVRSILGFGVQWSGEKVSQFADLNSLDGSSGRMMESNSPPGLPQPIGLTASAFANNSVLQALAIRAGWSKSQAKDNMIGAILALLCGPQAWPDAARGDPLLIHRLLASGNVLSAQDIADLWAFYAPIRQPVEGQPLDELRALVKDRSGFTEMADYGGRVVPRHNELHRAFADALRLVRAEQPAPTQGTGQPDPTLWENYVRTQLDLRVKEQVNTAINDQWTGVIRPVVVLSILLASLALGVAVVALALLLRTRQSAMRGGKPASGREQGVQANLPGEIESTFRRVAEQHGARLAVLDCSMNALEAEVKALRTALASPPPAAVPPEWDDLWAELERLQQHVNRRLGALESGIASVIDSMTQTRNATPPATTRVSADIAVELQPGPEAVASDRRQAARSETVLPLRQENFLQLLVMYGADRAALSRELKNSRSLDKPDQGKHFGELAIDLLPESLAPEVYKRVEEALEAATSGKFRLITPKPGDLYASAEHEIATYTAARKGNISRIDVLVRPGLRRGQDILRKARVIVPN